ncbi:hypothetical protein ABPG77_004616 [Micractinium sp. CCAP 211/92]
MAKGKRAKLRKKQQGMDIEGGSAGGSQSGGGDDTSGWQTGPMGEDGGDGFIALDTTDAGAAPGGKQAGAGQAAGGPKGPAPKRGQASRKQQARKRKSMERALAVASRTETKTKQREGAKEKRKSLKKLWQNEKKGE